MPGEGFNYGLWHLAWGAIREGEEEQKRRWDRWIEDFRRVEELEY